MICITSSKSHSILYQKMNLKWCLTNQEGRGRDEWSSDGECKTAVSPTIAILSPGNYPRCVEDGDGVRWALSPHPQQLSVVINSQAITWWPSICWEGRQLQDEDKVTMWLYLQSSLKIKIINCTTITYLILISLFKKNTKLFLVFCKLKIALLESERIAGIADAEGKA